MTRNNVRGPTSALTEFLRESGITATTVARRWQTAEQTTAGPSNGNEQPAEGENVEGNRSHRGTNESGARNGYNSDELDESEDAAPSPKKRKLSKKAQAELKKKEKAKKKKTKGGDSDDEDYEDDEYTALSKSMFAGSSKSPVKPPVGSFDNCVKCTKQFTVTRYTVAANPPPGFLCHECAKASGDDPFKKPAAPRRRKNIEDKRKIVIFEEKEFESLASLCIKIISRHIDDVEALGDIGSVNTTEIARILSKNRSLTPENAKLMYDIRNTTLTFHDATRLTPAALCTLGSLNPALESLRLDYCGLIDNVVMSHWSGHLPSLTRLELFGPFLIRVDGWKMLFESHPQLTGFLITQSPRFDLSCMEALVLNCPNLTELRLCQVGELTDEFLPHIATLKNLTTLDLSETSTSLSNGAVVELLAAVGSGLTHLNLSDNELLTDSVLDEGIQPHVKHLSTLVLNKLPDLTNEGVAAFFTSFTSNPPLHTIFLQRNHFLSDESLIALITHSGSALIELGINSWKDVSDIALKSIGTHAAGLKKLDIGWCRQVDDFVIKTIINGCEAISDINCYGCNKLTENCPRKRGINIRGIETHNI